MIPRHLVIAMAVLLVAVLGLSMYAWHMRSTVASVPAPSTDTRPLAPPIAGPTERVILFIAHDSDGSLRPVSAQIPMPSGRQQRAEELLRALLSLYLDFDYGDLRERDYPLIAPSALAERLRKVAELFPPNNGFEFAILYKRRG